MSRVPACLLLVVVLATATACDDSARSPSEPTSAAGISGRITSVVPNGSFRGTIRVEARPESPSSGDKAVVTVTGSTTILLISRAEGEFRSLQAGQWVRVWFDGPVAESYPVQGTAATVVIDSSGTTLMNRAIR